MEACNFCEDKRCEGCPLPYTEDMIYGDLLGKIGITTNSSFYSDGYKRGKQDVIFDVVWNMKIDKDFFG